MQMQSFIQNATALISNPVMWILLLGYYAVSALIGGMPMPDDKSSKAYRYWFKVLNGFAANLHRAAAAAQIPQTDEGKQ